MRNIDAYRATFESLFPIGKKFGSALPVKLLFGNREMISRNLNPLVLRRVASSASLCMLDFNHRFDYSIFSKFHISF